MIHYKVSTVKFCCNNSRYNNNNNNNVTKKKRQAETDEEELERQLCKDKGAGEWFRLEAGKEKCRDVIQCTASVRVRIAKSEE